MGEWRETKLSLQMRLAEGERRRTLALAGLERYKGRLRDAEDLIAYCRRELDNNPPDPPDRGRLPG